MSGLKKLCRTLLPAAVLLLAVLAAQSTAWACPSCKAALAAGDADQANLVRGFFWSILFMLSMPFAILGTFGVCMYRAVQRAKTESPAAEAPPGSPTH